MPVQLRTSTSRLAAIRPWVLSLLLTPIGVWAQTAGEAPALQDWRAANDAVAEFKRGHIDLLKWEARNLPPAVLPEAVKPDLMLMTPADVVRQAWRSHPGLAVVQATLGQAATQRVAEGQLDAVDPSLQRRVDEMGELLAVANEARKTWIEAVAARKVLRFREAALTSAEAGHELGQRMVAVGNWSPLQSTRVQLATSAARMDLRRAQLASAQADVALLKLLRLAGTPTVLGLPSAFPEAPAELMAQTVWAQRLQAVRAQLPAISGVQNDVASRMAFDIYNAAHALFLMQRDEVLKTRRYITEETLLHYNGMLKSVWDLLDEVRSQAVAEIDAIAAERDFWLAEADVQLTLQGHAPNQFVALGGGGADAGGPAAAH